MPLAHEHIYKFDELPLVTREGLRGAMIDGSAHLTYEWCDAGYMDWAVEAFEFDGYKLVATRPLLVTAESDPELFKLLEAALDAHFGEHIVDRLSDELEAA